MQQLKVVLAIAGSDSCAGAGIQADIKSISANQAYCATAIAAITAQNTQGVQAVESVSVSMIQRQIESVCDDIAVAAVKVGLLANRATIDCVARCCRQYQWQRVVVDPVMVAQSGDRLVCEQTQQALVTKLFPHATLITPNVPEAACLLGQNIMTLQDQCEAAHLLARQYSLSVLLKGGHLNDDLCVDVLVHKGQLYKLSVERIKTMNTHGTGCSLSSAIAANLAQGVDLHTAVVNAQRYVHGAIEHALEQRLGFGAGPIAHFYRTEVSCD